MLAFAAIPSWISWSLNPREFIVGAGVCPPLADGNLQAGTVALNAGDAQTAFLLAFIATVVVALAAVVVAYGLTHRIGRPFVHRWWHFLGWGMLASLLASFLLTVTFPVHAACDAGDTVTSIPAAWAALRALVAAAHGGVLYLVLSAVLSGLLGRVLKRGRWYDNHRIPVPYYLPRRHG